MRAFSQFRYVSIFMAAIGLATALLPSHAMAQDYPSRPIRMVVPFVAGDRDDIIARDLAKVMSLNLGQAVVVDNRAGANSRIGNEAAARAAPDGYTLLFNAASYLAASAQSGASFNVARDLVEVATIGDPVYGLYVGSKVRANSMQELVEMMRREELYYATPGEGSGEALLGRALHAAAGSKMLDIAYRTVAAAMTDVIANRVHMLFLPTAVAEQQVRDGRLKLLAVAGPGRASSVPNIPAVAEVLPSFQQPALSWSLYAPAGTPAAVMTRLGEVLKVRSTPEYQQLADRMGLNGNVSEVQRKATAEREAANQAAVAASAEDRARQARVSQALGAESRTQASRLFGQGFELFQAGEFEAAVMQFKKGLEIDPANAIAHFYLAETYTRQKYASLARQHYEATVHFDPDSKEAAIAAVRLK